MLKILNKKVSVELKKKMEDFRNELSHRQEELYEKIESFTTEIKKSTAELLHIQFLEKIPVSMKNYSENSIQKIKNTEALESKAEGLLMYQFLSVQKFPKIS